MRLYSTILISLCLFFPAVLLANNVTPIAVITNDISRDFFFDGESVTFDGTGSYDRDESGSYITAYSWTIDGSTYTSSTPTVTFSLTSGQQSKTVTVKLKVRDDEYTWSSEVTKTYTVRRSQQRYFYVKDHLGSVRVTVDEEGEPLGYDDYYPFGLVMPGRSSNVSNPDDLYKYTGHERDNEIGLDLTYAGARYLDPVTGIWLSIDPKVDDYPGWSPYNYSLNNPVNLWDPDGKAPSSCCLTSQMFGGIGSIVDVVHATLGDRAAQSRVTARLAYATTTTAVTVGAVYAAPYIGSGLVTSSNAALSNPGTTTTVVGTTLGALDPNPGADYIPGPVDNVGNSLGQAVRTLGDDATRIPLNRLNHIFGKSEHALESLVMKFGSQEEAFKAVQTVANEALKAGKLTPNARGILPSGNLGNIINVRGMDVRLIGGKVEDGKVILSSFSRKGLE
ncbi:RHS repeat-associated core domain-containing protein [Gracilimonas tropica]|uniref:RHS repeat-associated core domain-containing protein n=1 Tax=Gracilimonas tropica TaxID=454600 RepID=UPI000371D69E|nr:RHS repeat-associated core domain-containing protein [Gracilimonas tropica]